MSGTNDCKAVPRCPSALVHWCLIILGAKRKNIFWRHAKCGCWRSGCGASWMFVSHESCFVLCSVLFTLSTQIYLIRFMKQHLSCNSAEKVCPPTVGKWGTEGSFKSIYTWWVLETCLTCDPNLVHPSTGAWTPSARRLSRNSSNRSTNLQQVSICAMFCTVVKCCFAYWETTPSWVVPGPELYIACENGHQCKIINQALVPTFAFMQPNRLHSYPNDK